MTRRDPVARLRNSLEVFQIPQNSSLSSPASSTGRCRACAQAGREPMALRVSPRPCPSRARAPTTANQTLEPGIRRDPETVADLSSRAALTVGTLRSLLMEWTSTALTPARSPSLHGRCPRRRSAAASLQGNSTVEHASTELQDAGQFVVADWGPVRCASRHHDLTTHRPTVAEVSRQS